MACFLLSEYDGRSSLAGKAAYLDGPNSEMHRSKRKNTRIMKKQGNMAFSKHLQLLHKWIQRCRNDWTSRQASAVVTYKSEWLPSLRFPSNPERILLCLSFDCMCMSMTSGLPFLPHRQTQRGNPQVTWVLATLTPPWRQPLPYLCSRALEPEHHGGAGTPEQVKVKQNGLVPVKKENTNSVYRWEHFIGIKPQVLWMHRL